jgi:membrane protein implicated in regulation of membrane protease activity
VNRGGWTYQVLFKYILLQVPGAVLLVALLLLFGRWTDLPAWFFWGLILFWILKDIIMFPLVWRAYESPSPEFLNPLFGAKGVAKEPLDPAGYIQVRGELWRSELKEKGPAVDRGEGVRVQGISGLTLLVEREQESDQEE